MAADRVPWLVSGIDSRSYSLPHPNGIYPWRLNRRPCGTLPWKFTRIPRSSVRSSGKSPPIRRSRARRSTPSSDWRTTPSRPSSSSARIASRGHVGCSTRLRRTRTSQSPTRCRLLLLSRRSEPVLSRPRRAPRERGVRRPDADRVHRRRRAPRAARWPGGRLRRRRLRPARNLRRETRVRWSVRGYRRRRLRRPHRSAARGAGDRARTRLLRTPLGPPLRTSLPRSTSSPAPSGSTCIVESQVFSQYARAGATSAPGSVGLELLGGPPAIRPWRSRPPHSTVTRSSSHSRTLSTVPWSRSVPNSETINAPTASKTRSSGVSLGP